MMATFFWPPPVGDTYNNDTNVDIDIDGGHDSDDDVCDTSRNDGIMLVIIMMVRMIVIMT